MIFFRNFNFKIISISIILLVFSLISGANAHGGGFRGLGRGISRGYSSGFSGISDPSSASYDPNLLLIIILFVILVLIVVGYVFWKIWDRKRTAKEMIRHIEKHDDAWKLEEIEQRVEETFFKLHESWMKQDMYIARDYMTNSLYRMRNAQLDGLKSRQHKNMVENLRIKNLDLVGLGDYMDDNMDYFWVHIKGSKYDYFVDNRTGRLVAGDKSLLKSFSETWKFVRSHNGWIADQIHQYAIWDILNMDSFTEGYDGPSGLNDEYGGYLACESCGGYYMLEKGELPDDFDVCQCGGNLKYYDDLNNLLNDQDAINGKMRSNVYKFSDNN